MENLCEVWEELEDGRLVLLHPKPSSDMRVLTAELWGLLKTMKMERVKLQDRDNALRHIGRLVR